MAPKAIWGIVKDTAKLFTADKTTRLAAALAYYSVFSLGPLLVIVTAIAGLAFGDAAVQGDVFAQLRSLIGDQAAASVQSMVQAAYHPRAGLITSVIGAVVLLVGASGVITQLKDSLNAIWEVQPRDDAGIRYFVKTYIVSLAAIMGIGFLLLVSLVASTVIAALGAFATARLPLPEVALEAANSLLSLVIITCLFGFMYRFLPDVKVPWRAVFPGAAVTALLFTAGKLGLGLYLGRASFSSFYGAAGSIMVLLAWVYYSSLIFLIGAELTRVYAAHRGFETRPTQDAQRMTPQHFVQQGFGAPRPRLDAPT